jgi:transcriptional regulator with XRE-family HTH domain
MSLDALRRKLDAVRNTFDYRVERILFDVAEQVCSLMETSELSRSDLARRMEVSPAYITKLLSGNPNLTIKSLLKLSDALGQDLHVGFKPKVEIGQVATTVVQPIAHPGRYVDMKQQIPAHSEVSNDLLLAA